MTFPALGKTLASSAVLALLAVPASAIAPSAAPKAEKGYSVSVFAQGIPGKYTAPDSIAVLDGHVFIGYGDGNAPTGADGKSNQIVEYTRDGTKVFVYTLLGHNDGLKVNPYTHKLWAMQNEDANPNLVIIDPKTKSRRSTPLLPRRPTAEAMTTSSSAVVMPTSVLRTRQRTRMLLRPSSRPSSSAAPSRCRPCWRGPPPPPR